MPTSKTNLIVVLLCLVSLQSANVGAEDLAELKQLVTLEPKPFVLVEATAGNTVSRAQGVVISPQGHVLSVGHVTFVSPENGFSDRFRIGMRGRGNGAPEGFVHVHTARFADREGAEFQEHIYNAGLVQKNESRFVESFDLSLFQISATGELPYVKFYSQEEPKVKLGETLYMCHYNSPHGLADPTFLINPIKIVGVAQTSSGLQYLAEGYYRVGSSGGAILKNGRLIGIQSSAYTINAKDVGEIPLGLISFHLVWGDLIQEHAGIAPVDN